jgi:glycosyltransferase involved in cell wall biosynthesis
MHEGPLRLLFLGLICEKKGIFDLLKVIKKGIEDNRSLMLTIGGIGEVARLTDEIDRLGLRGSVEYLGWVSAEVRDMLMRKTDIFILPSYGEGMPMTILEAMSYAIPVISTPVGGIPELVIEDETGFLVKPGDLSGLYERIIELATDEEKRCRFGRRGRQVIEEKHNLSENIKTIDAIYDTI